jgi:hypothetical protein
MIRATIAAAMAALALAVPASASAAPALEVSLEHLPRDPFGVVSGRHALYEVTVSNSGDAPTSAPVSVHFDAPAGLAVVEASDEIARDFEIPTWECSIPTSQSADCEGPEFEGTPLSIGPGDEACEEELAASCRILVELAAAPGLPRGELTVAAQACGGGAASCAVTEDVIPLFAGFEFVLFDGMSSEENGDPLAQAGAHPFSLSNEFKLPATLDDVDHTLVLRSLRDVAVTLPPGLVGYPLALPRCIEVELVEDTCPTDTQVGLASVNGADGSTTSKYPVYNMVPPPGRGGEFGFNIDGGVAVHIFIDARPDGRLVVGSENISQFAVIAGSELVFWGVPADPAHDPQRVCHPGEGTGCASGQPQRAFLSLPTSCEGQQHWAAAADSWQESGRRLPSGEPDLSDPAWAQASFLSHDDLGSPLPTEGCNALDYASPSTAPSLQARPTTNATDSPSGFEVEIQTPQNVDPEGLAEAHLKSAKIVLPPGLTINPSGANGLGACTSAQIGVDPNTGEPDGEEPTCPDTSKIGTVRVQTPLLDHPAPGAVYVAMPYDNPFDSLTAIYIVLDDPLSGTLLKFSGEVILDPQTGRLTTIVDDAPQLPFDSFEVKLKTGAGAPLRTPAACGTYTTTSVLTPWSAPESGPPATPFDSYSMSQSPAGGECPTSEAAQPHAPSFDAGTVTPIAGSYSPFVIDLRRADGTQQLSSVSLSLPPGLLAKLAGTDRCADAALAAAAQRSGAAEQASPSCPDSSRVGSIVAAAGAGPAPYHVPGAAYLAGPYKGAPLSLAVVTPAVAGPYDLGTIVVRSALTVDPISGRITATTDPIPTILEGIPIDLRSVTMRIDKPQFTFNGTSCDPSAIPTNVVSVFGRLASLESRFQLAECTGLAFKPKLSLGLRGGTRRGANPALRATLRMPGGGANLGSMSVALPRSAFLDQEHIRTVCTRVQFAADACPAGSVYGHLSVSAPLFSDRPFEGPVYLRSSSHKLPDLLFALQGPPELPISIEVAGRIDSVRGTIRTSFESFPDVPFSRAVLSMAGGRKGLLQNSRNLCAGAPGRATVLADGQNGKVFDTRPPLKARCKGSGMGRGKRQGRR